MQQFLLLLLTIALMVAPLRGSFALPVPVASAATEHCAHQQEGMPGMQHAAGQHDPAVDEQDHGCDHGCAGGCCDGACGTCVHVSVALPAAAAMMAAHYGSVLAVPAAPYCAGCTVHPPFRPPITFS